MTRAPTQVYVVEMRGKPRHVIGGKCDTLTSIRALKRQKYMEKGFPYLFAHVHSEEFEDRGSRKKSVMRTVPIVQDFPEVFPEASGLPRDSTMEFQIDLVPAAAPVARAPYRCAFRDERVI
ncbi:hypothetical protein Tco_0384992 [Tanacetum coccineum]